MRNNNSKNTLFFAVCIILAGFGILFLFDMLEVDIRWFIIMLIILCMIFITRFVNDVDFFLLRALIFTLPFGTGFIYNEVVGTDLIFAFDAIIFFLYFIWFMKEGAAVIKKFSLNKYYIPAILMIIWSLLPLGIAQSGVGCAVGVYLLFKAFLIYYYILNHIKTKKQLMGIIDVLVISLGIQGILGVAQRILGRSLGLTFLGENEWGSYWWELSRVNGTLNFPNQYAAYLILIIPLAASMLIVIPKLKKVWYIVAVIFGLLGVIFSLSRSAWLGIALAFIIMLVLMLVGRSVNRKLIFSLLFGILIIAIIGIAFQDLISLRLETGGSGEYRKLMIRMSYQIILSNPIIGVGLFNYQYHTFQSFQFWHPVHNEFLRLAAETGIPGLFFFLWFLLVALRNAYHSLKLKDRLLNIVALGLIGGYTAFLIAIMFGPQYQRYRQKSLFWVIAALMLVLKKIKIRELLILKRNRELQAKKFSERRLNIE